jgi:protease I
VGYIEDWYHPSVNRHLEEDDMASVLMIIAPDQFRDEEYLHPKEVLDARGADVVTASVAPGPCRGKLGAIVQATMALADAHADDYEAVVFVGGAGASVFFDDPFAHSIATRMVEDEKLVAAICIAPSTLAHAGLLQGRAATAFPSQEGDLGAHGAHFTGAPVQIDDHIITANGPDAAYEFGTAIADAIGLDPP